MAEKAEGRIHVEGSSHFTARKGMFVYPRKIDPNSLLTKVGARRRYLLWQMQLQNGRHASLRLRNRYMSRETSSLNTRFE